MVLIQEAPYVLRDGDKIYAVYEQGADIIPSGYTVSYDEAAHKTEAVWENCGSFSYSEPQINACYTFPKSAGFRAGDTVIYPQPLLRVQGIYGEEYDCFRAQDESGYMTFLRRGSEELSLTSGETKHFLTGTVNKEVVVPVADFQLSNMGVQKTGSKRLTYAFEGTSGVGVTTLRLIMPKKEDCVLTKNGKVEILYTVMDENGRAVDEKVYTGRQELSPHDTDDSGGSIILSRDNEMIEQHYYFRTVTYLVKALQPGTLYYSGTSPYTGGGVICAKRTESTNKPTAGETCLTASLVIASQEEDGTNPVSQEIRILVADDDPVTTMGFRNDPLNADTSIPPGGTLTVDAKLEVGSYPSYTTMFVTAPVFYFRLPKELSLVDGSLKTDCEGISPVMQAAFPETDAAGRETGFTLTPVTIVGMVPFGYYNEKLEAIGGRAGLTLTFTLQASGETSVITHYDLRDLVCAGAEDVSLHNGSSGWDFYSWPHNPTTADGYSKGIYRVTYSNDPALNTVFTVQAAVPMASFYDGSTTAGDGNELTLTGAEKSQSVKWEITKKREFIININGGSAIAMPRDGLEAFSGSLSSNSLSGGDTRHDSDYLTLSLSLYDGTGSTAVNFPAGTAVMVNNVTSGTSGNRALLSLGNVRTDYRTSFAIQIKTSGWMLAPGSYQLKAALYCSRAEGYISAFPSHPEAEASLTLKVEADPACGLKVKQTDGIGRLVEPEASLKFQLYYTAGSDVKFSAALYEKKDGIYSQSASAWNSLPVFTAADGICTADVEIPKTVHRGSTYRIVFCMESGGKVTKVPYNIIILEEGERQAD